MSPRSLRSPALGALSLLVAAACGAGATSQAPPAQAPAGPVATAWTPSPDIQEPAPAATSDATRSVAAAPAPAETSTASAAASDPSTVQELYDDTTHAPSAVLKAKAVGDASAAALAQGLDDLAKTKAPGMDPDGPLATGTLKEKESLQEDVTFVPGRCYAILGYSKQVKDVDLYLLLPPGILTGQDGTYSSTPVLGGAGHPLCPIATQSITYKLRIVADHGAGEVGVQVYSKAR
jgi:hypothetical protein